MQRQYSKCGHLTDRWSGRVRDKVPSPKSSARASAQPLGCGRGGARCSRSRTSGMPSSKTENSLRWPLRRQNFARVQAFHGIKDQTSRRVRAGGLADVSMWWWSTTPRLVPGDNCSALRFSRSIRAASGGLRPTSRSSAFNDLCFARSHRWAP